MCNSALRALEQARSREPERGEAHRKVDAVLRHMRNLLIALHDLNETAGASADYPLEREAAHDILAMLVEQPAETPADDLIDAAFQYGSALATDAIGLMQREG
jgi:hypothetical protein